MELVPWFEDSIQLQSIIKTDRYWLMYWWTGYPTSRYWTDTAEWSIHIRSECMHHPNNVYLIAHPTNRDYLLESCALCKVIRNYNIRTGQCKIVFRHEQLGPLRMCHGPNDSILFLDMFSMRVFELNWEKDQQELCFNRLKPLTSTSRMLFQALCYVEKFNLLIFMNTYEEIEAVEFGSLSAIWKLSGVVDGHMIKPGRPDSRHRRKCLHQGHSQITDFSR